MGSQMEMSLYPRLILVALFLLLAAQAAENRVQRRSRASWDHKFLRVARNRAPPDHRLWNTVVRVARDGQSPLLKPRWWWGGLSTNKTSDRQISREQITTR